MESAFLLLQMDKKRRVNGKMVNAKDGLSSMITAKT
jgi:hypothetical protein